MMLRDMLTRNVPTSIRKAIRTIVPYETQRDAMFRAWRRKDTELWSMRKAATGCRKKEELNDYEYSVFSQNGEDGIIRYLLSLLGAGSSRFLEFGFSASEGCCMRLALLAGYQGLFIDGNRQTIRNFRHRAKSLRMRGVKAICRFLTVSSIEKTIAEGGMKGEIDVLSIDVDGNDYWLWEALGCVSPRIVVIEYNASLGPSRSLSVPYDPTFDRHEKHPSGFYHGASLTALEKLGKRKGYRLVGCDANGVNAFFLRDDLSVPGVGTVCADLAWKPNAYRGQHLSVERQYALIEALPFVDIE